MHHKSKNVVLTNKSTSYKFWNKLPQPVEFKVYIWEVENPDRVLLYGEKPKMKEAGPYTYLLNRAKENIKFSEDGNFVEFEQRTFYEFSPELSGPNLSEDDEVTVLNSALMRNGKTDGHFKVMTGKSDVSKLGQIVEWEHNSTLQFWSGDECNTIRGSDATIFPPFLDEESKIYVYSTDLCRSLYLTYDKEIEHKGVNGYRYVVDPVQLGNVSSVPENYCYCPSNGACLKEGVNDLSPCYSKISNIFLTEAPVIFSMPHFYGAPQYEQLVENLKPNKEEHQTYLDVETNSGAVLRAVRRVQYNLMIKPIRWISMPKNLPGAILPLFWVDESFDLNEENTDFWKYLVVNSINLVDTIRWTLLGVGCILFLIGTALHCHKQTTPTKHKKQASMCPTFFNKKLYFNK
ncbi:platelet glycoprotein 4-like [Cloeon dipterum]|uniref:platelet glycoprotein 4-like n=1 Tax=Cloeon dipterum TaxID=197152 RepID=UPI003220088C